MQNIILKMNKIFLKSFFLTIGFAFLYFPILTLIAYSFNDNKRVMVWKGFSFRWYGELFKNEQILEAFMISIKIASLSATCLLYTSPSPRDRTRSRMPSSA